MRSGRLFVAVIASTLAGATPAALASSSLYSGPGPRPGPDILYRAPAVAPQLTNTGIWRAAPILVSGATAYRDGEFLYQDWLYDDHGARELPDPNDPRAGGDTFSKPDGTYTYPTGPGYDNDAADLVEFRVKPQSTETAFRVTMNTLQNPSLIAFSIAIGGTPGDTHPFPDGANVSAPADLFLTVHPSGTKLVADLVHASSGAPVSGPAPAVTVDPTTRQIEVDVPHADWNPGTSTVRFAMGVGLWDSSTGTYLLPQATASATEPGGGGTASNPPAFFNVAFRTNSQEPLPSVTAGSGSIIDPRWWRDEAQGTALATGDISQFYANVSFAKLSRKVTDNSQIPTTGTFDRILASHFEPAQGANFSSECGLQGSSNPASCTPEYTGQLQPYAIYVPTGPTPPGGWGLTLLLHSLSANYNQYMGSRNQSQFANRAVPSIVITPEARGPDQFYQGLGGADVFEVWAAVARLYQLDPAYTDVTGYSMGGMGTFKLGSQFPDLFARAQPTVGYEPNTDVLASMRNLPVLMWNVTADELVNATDYTQTAMKLANLGYRYELDVYQPCANTLCSALFPNHLQLAINDQFAPAAAFLGSATVNYNPAHVTYAVDGARNYAQYGMNGDHAYWVSGLTLRSQSNTSSNGDPIGQFDAVSHGFGVGDPTASGVQGPTPGTLSGGNMGNLQYAAFTQTWGSVPSATRADAIDVNATNIATASIDVQRAGVDCNVKLNITTDGPVTVTLPGCNRVVQAG
ncbi:MAG TPA: glucodextranase DOMON-like domain-containing protein [Solirubrobacteraceae bacterium]|nr:glucodextranase DOMON-like domain-containing protein [Solirubrobacteraceae bacterium]